VDIKRMAGKYLKTLKIISVICVMITFLFIISASLYRYYEVLLFKKYIEDLLKKDFASIEMILKLKGSVDDYEETINICDRAIQERTELCAGLRGFNINIYPDLREKLLNFINSENELVQAKKTIYLKEKYFFIKLAGLEKFTANKVNSPEKIERYISFNREIPDLILEIGKSVDDYGNIYEKVLSEENDLEKDMKKVSINFSSVLKVYHLSNKEMTEDINKYVETIKIDRLLKNELTADTVFIEILLELTDLDSIGKPYREKFFKFSDLSIDSRNILIDRLNNFYPLSDILREKLLMLLKLRNELSLSKRELLETYVLLSDNMEFCSTGIDMITSSDTYDFSLQSVYINKTIPLCRQTLATIPVLNDRCDEYLMKYDELLNVEIELSNPSFKFNTLTVMKKYEEKNKKLIYSLKEGMKKVRFNNETLLDKLLEFQRLLQGILYY